MFFVLKHISFYFIKYFSDQNVIRLPFFYYFEKDSNKDFSVTRGGCFTVNDLLEQIWRTCPWREKEKAIRKKKIVSLFVALSRLSASLYKKKAMMLYQFFFFFSLLVFVFHWPKPLNINIFVFCCRRLSTDPYVRSERSNLQRLVDVVFVDYGNVSEGIGIDQVFRLPIDDERLGPLLDPTRNPELAVGPHRIVGADGKISSSRDVSVRRPRLAFPWLLIPRSLCNVVSVFRRGCTRR